MEEEDLAFIRRFVLASGSLKDLAAEYGVSYPTIRVRLDRVIDAMKAAEKHQDDDAFERRVRRLVADRRLDRRVAQELMRLHRTETGR